MKNRKTHSTAIRTASVTALVAVFAVGASACGGGMHSRHNMDPDRAKKMVSWKIDDHLDDIDATDSQRTALNKIAHTVVDDAFATHDDDGTTKRGLLAEWRKDDPDIDAMDKLIEERAAEYVAFAKNTARRSLEVHGVLDADQREKLATEMEERMDERKDTKRRRR